MTLDKCQTKGFRTNILLLALDLPGPSNWQFLTDQLIVTDLGFDAVNFFS